MSSDAGSFSAPSAVDRFEPDVRIGVARLRPALRSGAARPRRCRSARARGSPTRPARGSSCQPCASSRSGRRCRASLQRAEAAGRERPRDAAAGPRQREQRGHRARVVHRATARRPPATSATRGCPAGVEHAPTRARRTPSAASARRCRAGTPRPPAAAGTSRRRRRAPPPCTAAQVRRRPSRDGRRRRGVADEARAPRPRGPARAATDRASAARSGVDGRRVRR